MLYLNETNSWIYWLTAITVIRVEDIANRDATNIPMLTPVINQTVLMHCLNFITNVLMSSRSVNSYFFDFVNGINMGAIRLYAMYFSPNVRIKSLSSNRIAVRMYAVHNAANRKCAIVIVGVAQNAMIQPRYNGCLTYL